VQRKNGRDRSGGLDDLGGRSGRARAAVEGDKIGAGMKGHLQVSLDVAGRQLDPDGFTSCLIAQPFHLGLQPVGCRDVFEMSGADDVLSDRESPDGGNLFRDLGGRQMPSHAGLG